MISAKAGHKKSRVSEKSARSAVKAVKKAQSSKKSPKSAAWKKGGSQWTRIFGHFGATSE